ncbi:hypothetical protein LTR84_011122 [Exophiala bonariae]|uniref:ML-like domain-containing protein n=1 Tax=Exophiala bonariae TaxID=1690606 RepID=A0AAV9NKU9_9EURO|nr:hypothetical protein LTR84_011122 [Exophiala bonariae]
MLSFVKVFIFLMLSPFITLGLCATYSLAHININYPLGQWDFTEAQQENGSFCGGGVSTEPSPWLAQNPFISLSGDAGEFVAIRFAYSNSNTNGSDQFVSTINDAGDFNTTLVANATIPDSGNLCVNATLPPLAIGGIGIIYVAAINPETGANGSSCATIEYIPESVEGQTNTAPGNARRKRSTQPGTSAPQNTSPVTQMLNAIVIAMAQKVLISQSSLLVLTVKHANLENL